MKGGEYQRVARDSFDSDPDSEELQPLQLNVDKESRDEEQELLEPTSKQHQTASKPSLIRLRNGLFTLFTIANLAVCLYLLFTQEHPIDPRTLRMPDQFYGLDKSFDSGAPWLSNTTVITFPTLLQQISQEEPSKVYPDDPRRYRSGFGTLSPEDRPLYVSSSISTIVQFRVRDYHMDTCTLKMILPADRSFSPHNQTISVGRERNWRKFDGSMEIDVWKLSPSEKSNPWIEPRSLSFRNRPRRDGEVPFAKLAVQGGEEVSSQEFRCRKDDVLSFELTCEGCVLDVWQDKQMPAMGLIVEQKFS